MGRTSKFSFPIPGRKHASTAGKEEPPVKSSSGARGNNLSKAQRILGTDNDLNIDSPTRDDEHPWKYPGSRSSGMSISISESTQSTNESGSIHEHQTDQWDRESGVFPRNSRLYGKASSTLLGQRIGDDGLTSVSSVSSRLRSEDSSSTLKSYYDRQKSPLSISQQTSASSARDLALRKGYPPVIQRSPLLQVESALDPFDAQFSGKGGYAEQNAAAESLEKSSRKKPARLDLSMLFPRSKRPSSMTPSPSSVSTNASQNTTNNSESGRRKLKKSHSKESIQSQKHSIRSTRSHDPQQRQTNGTLLQIYDHYEHMPVRSPHMDRIPESRVYESHSSRDQLERQSRMNGPSNTKTSRDSYSHSNSSEHQPFSWKNVRASVISPPWESSSAASISSRNTKTSRQTNGSVLSSSDLQEKSVLSLSSDSEDDELDAEAIQSPNSVPHNNYQPSDTIRASSRSGNRQRQQSQQQSGALTVRRQSSKASNNLEVPAARSNSRVSNAYTQPEKENVTPPAARAQRQSSHKEKKVSRTSSSVKSERSSQQPTPPLSPTSMEFRQTSERSSRFMAVTKQEEALLEALRQKRARMREEIIEEHETAKSPSPPRIPSRNASRASGASVSTIRGPRNSGKQKGEILLYLNTPASETHQIGTAEPSPDLSMRDFGLSYGESDEDSTPRTSWAPPKRGQPRPDSLVSPRPQFDHFSPKTPPSAARLSAVGGGVGGLKEDRSISQKKRNTGVRFVDAQDFLLDDDEGEVLWRL
ncbi:uncharacterized protein PAC_07019 [Phialocephala subalpina]|uniref:Uncharacterized protein n=1 Tax=Phialocephala subalpina TaxID=576137 RepID=A0A1L7WWJ4_9HELO|nr:uncharacterized protein PAC_07019 [Phialocephala subalpina]